MRDKPTVLTIMGIGFVQRAVQDLIHETSEEFTVLDILTGLGFYETGFSLGRYGVLAEEPMLVFIREIAAGLARDGDLVEVMDVEGVVMGWRSKDGVKKNGSKGRSPFDLPRE